MRGVAFLFFTTGVVCVSLGMMWGIHMAISGDHLLAPAHAHLNLVGWVTMALFGVYYHLVPSAAQSGLAKLHYLLALAGVVCMVPGIVLAVAEKGEAMAAIGSILTLASMLVFLLTVVRNRAV